MKKFLLIIMLLTTCIFTTFVISIKNEEIVESNEIQTREVVGEKEDEVFCMMNRVMGGGGYANQNIAEYAGTVAGGGGGVALVGLAYFISNQCNNFFNNLFSNYNIENSNQRLSIDDVLSNEIISSGIEKYGWKRDELVDWLEKMLGVSISHFLNDNNIKVFLGSTEYELKYYSYRDIENHKYTFSVNPNDWKKLVSNVCFNNYDMVWILNMAFLQLCIMKNATFVLVTPTIKYYDYYNRIPLTDNQGRTYFYSKELHYINNYGYHWNDFYKEMVEATR